MTTDTKRCARCLKTKPASAYTRHARTNDGLQSYCRACMTANARETRGTESVTLSYAAILARVQPTDDERAAIELAARYWLGHDGRILSGRLTAEHAIDATGLPFRRRMKLVQAAITLALEMRERGEKGTMPPKAKTAPKRKPRPSDFAPVNLSDEDMEGARAMLRCGYTLQAVADEFDLSTTWVWKHVSQPMKAEREAA